MKKIIFYTMFILISSLITACATETHYIPPVNPADPTSLILSATTQNSTVEKSLSTSVVPKLKSLEVATTQASSNLNVDNSQIGDNNTKTISSSAIISSASQDINSSLLNLNNDVSGINSLVQQYKTVIKTPDYNQIISYIQSCNALLVEIKNDNDLINNQNKLIQSYQDLIKEKTNELNSVVSAFNKTVSQITDLEQEIAKDNGLIADANSKLSGAEGSASQLKTDYANLKTDYDKKVTENTELKSASTRERNAWLTAAFLVGLALIGFGIFIQLEGAAAGWKLSIVGVLMCSLSAVATYFYQYFEYAGLGIIILLVGSLLYILYERLSAQKSTNATTANLATTNTALKEVVQTTEAAKQVLNQVAPAQSQAIFGNNAVPGIASQIQSDATVAKVAQIRQTIPIAPSVPATSTVLPVAPAIAPVVAPVAPIAVVTPATPPTPTSATTPVVAPSNAPATNNNSTN